MATRWYRRAKKWYRRVSVPGPEGTAQVEVVDENGDVIVDENGAAIIVGNEI